MGCSSRWKCHCQKPNESLQSKWDAGTPGRRKGRGWGSARSRSKDRERNAFGTDGSCRRTESSSGSSKIQTPWRVWQASFDAKSSAVAVEAFAGERREGGALADALPALEDQHRVDLAAGLHRACDAGDEPFARDAADHLGVGLGYGRDGGVVLEPPVDARLAVPREARQVIADGVKRVIIRDDARGVDHVMLRQGATERLPEPVTHPVEVPVAHRLAHELTGAMGEGRLSPEDDALIELARGEDSFPFGKPVQGLDDADEGVLDVSGRTFGRWAFGCETRGRNDDEPGPERLGHESP
jgi:hypothetical protein